MVTVTAWASICAAYSLPRSAGFLVSEVSFSMLIMPFSTVLSCIFNLLATSYADTFPLYFTLYYVDSESTLPFYILSGDAVILSRVYILVLSWIWDIWGYELVSFKSCAGESCIVPSPLNEQISL